MRTLIAAACHRRAVAATAAELAGVLLLELDLAVLLVELDLAARPVSRTSSSAITTI